MSKGSRRRPQQVSNQEMEDNWQIAFSSKRPALQSMWYDIAAVIIFIILVGTLIWQ